MATQICLLCNEEYFKEAVELFCCDNHRFRYWAMKKSGCDTQGHLDDLKEVISRHRTEGKSLMKHLNRVLFEYDDWESRVTFIENRIYELEQQVKTEEELYHQETQANTKSGAKSSKEKEYDAFSDIYSILEED